MITERPVIVKIRNNTTGEIVDYATVGSFVDFIWSEGNYACDCNRSRFFDGLVEYEDRECGEEKYSIQITCDGVTVYDESRKP